MNLCTASFSKGWAWRFKAYAWVSSSLEEEWGELGGSVNVVVVLELAVREEFVPVDLVLVAEEVEVLLQLLVYTFGLAVRLVSGEVHYKLWPPVRDVGVREAMELPDVPLVQLCGAHGGAGGKDPDGKVRAVSFYPAGGVIIWEMEDGSQGHGMREGIEGHLLWRPTMSFLKFMKLRNTCTSFLFLGFSHSATPATFTGSISTAPCKMIVQAKMLDLGLLKLTLFQFEVELVLAEMFQDEAGGVAVFFQHFGVDENVVEIYTHYTFHNEVLEDVVHHHLEGGQAVGESKEHNKRFE
ncbi:hypothetical protein E4T56_gene16671 [Termitomyces sp. T112]|nr:hypothetical protein E4T56_gene16671 [Termitomyces sp. T112]